MAKSIVVSVDCERNDRVDISCGGPTVLGFDFLVSADDNVEGLYSFIASLLKKYNRPLIGMSYYAYLNVDPEEFWTKEGIEDCIKKGY